MKKKSVGHERPANLRLWIGDGISPIPSDARVSTKTQLSIGLTDSQRALGFIVREGDSDTWKDFVLDRDQIDDLISYLRMTRHRLRKPLGKRPQEDRRFLFDDMAKKLEAASSKRGSRKAQKSRR